MTLFWSITLIFWLVKKLKVLVTVPKFPRHSVGPSRITVSVEYKSQALRWRQVIQPLTFPVNSYKSSFFLKAHNSESLTFPSYVWQFVSLFADLWISAKSHDYQVSLHRCCSILFHQRACGKWEEEWPYDLTEYRRKRCSQAVRIACQRFHANKTKSDKRCEGISVRLGNPKNCIR